MFELFSMKAIMEGVSEYLDGVINDIQAGELEGTDARIVVDDAFERAYGTRKGILAILAEESQDGLTDEEFEMSKDLVNWAGEIITKCHVADELLEQDLEDSSFNFDFGFNREEDEKDCDSCEVKDLCEILNKKDIFE